MTNTRPLQYVLARLRELGHHPENQDAYRVKLLNLFWSVLMIFLTSLLVLRIILSETDIAAKADIISILCLDLRGAYNHFAMRRKRKNLIDLLKIVDQFWPLDKFGEEWRNEMELKFSRLLRFCYFVTGAYMASSAYYVIRPFIFGQRDIPIPLYDGLINYKVPGLFELFYILESIYILFIVYLMVGYDLLIFCSIIYAAHEFKMLQKAFQELPFRTKTEEEVLEKFCVNVEHHDRVLRFVDGINENYSISFLYQFSLTTVGICMCFFIISTNLSPFDADIVSKFVLQVICLYLQLGMYCAGGNSLTNESGEVGHALYNSEWTSVCYPKIRKGTVIVIQRTQRLARLSACGMFDMDLNSFTTSVKTSFSYFTLMKTVFLED